MEPVKKVRVESKIDVKMFVVVVMEIGMRLPWPDGAHLDSGMVAESVVVGIKQHKQEGDRIIFSLPSIFKMIKHHCDFAMTNAEIGFGNFSSRRILLFSF